MDLLAAPVLPVTDATGLPLAAAPGQEAGRLFHKDPAAMDEAELRRAAKEFDGYFISYLLKVMRETVPKGFLENKGGEHFYYFYDQEIGRLAAERGGLGFGKMVLEQYLAQHRADAQKNLSSPGGNLPIPESSR